MDALILKTCSALKSISSPNPKPQTQNPWWLQVGALLLTRCFTCLITTFTLWVLWERQRYYRQFVASPEIMQVKKYM